MTAFVVDASVAIEYLLPTQLGDSIAELIEGDEIVAPEMMDAEVLSVLRRWALHGRIGVQEAEAALNRLVDWPVVRVPNRELAQGAWAYRHNVSAYDALYVALARRRDLPILTADGRLARSPGLDIVVQTVRLA